MPKILLIFLLGFSMLAQAAVRKNVTDGESITVQLSSKDPNVISVKNDRIERFSVVKGAVLSSLDPKHGMLTIKPSSPEATEPFSMIVFTESGKRFTLVVLPIAIPSQDIILMSENTASGKTIPFEHQSPYTEVVTQLIRHMVNNSQPEDYKRLFVDEAPIVFMDGILKRTSVYQGNHLAGEILQFTHQGAVGTSLLEPAFHAKDVIAVAISQNYVKPGDVVTIFRVKRNG